MALHDLSRGIFDSLLEHWGGDRFSFELIAAMQSHPGLAKLEIEHADRMTKEIALGLSAFKTDYGPKGLYALARALYELNTLLLHIVRATPVRQRKTIARWARDVAVYGAYRALDGSNESTDNF